MWWTENDWSPQVAVNAMLLVTYDSVGCIWVLVSCFLVHSNLNGQSWSECSPDASVCVYDDLSVIFCQRLAMGFICTQFQLVVCKGCLLWVHCQAATINVWKYVALNQPHRRLNEIHSDVGHWPNGTGIFWCKFWLHGQEDVRSYLERSEFKTEGETLGSLLQKT